jgi:hypothetical protein
MTDSDREIEDRLRARLHERADMARPEPDFDAVATRAARVDSRQRRALTIALALVLVAGPALGFVVGRGSDDSGGDVAASGGDDPADDSEDAGDDVGTVAPGAPGFAGRTFASGAAGFDTGVASEKFGGISMAPDGTIRPAERLGLRTTADGVDIRLYRTTYPEGWNGVQEAPPWAPDWEPTGVCGPTGAAMAGISTELAVGESYLELWPDLPRATASYGAFGLEQSDAHWWVMLQTPPNVAEVQASFEGGATDVMEPIQGISILVGRAGEPGNDPWTPRGSVVLRDASGGTVEEIPLGPEIYSRGYSPWNDDDFEARCTPPPPPPPELPPAGEQPADVATASAAVTEAFENAFDGALTREERDEYFHDPTGEAREAGAQAGEAFPDAVASAKVQVKALVFTAPDTAVVRFDLDTSMSDFRDQFGEAKLIDGSWKVTDRTLCAMASYGGGSCPTVEPYPQPDPYAPWYGKGGGCGPGADCVIADGTAVLEDRAAAEAAQPSSGG